jgi:hypothetical protein
MTMEFRRDASGKPLWHNPLPNETFDSSRPYGPDNSPFSTCALCGQTRPCDEARARTAQVPVTGIWLRDGQQEDEIEVLAEIDGEWRTVIVETVGGILSHIVEPLGMRHGRPDRLEKIR